MQLQSRGIKATGTISESSRGTRITRFFRTVLKALMVQLSETAGALGSGTPQTDWTGLPKK